MNTQLLDLRHTTINMQQMESGEERVLSVAGPNGVTLSIRVTACAEGMRFDLMPAAEYGAHQLATLKGMTMNVINADIYSLEIKK